MKKNILALAIGGVLSAGAQADINDIFITEYVEGSAYNKAIELTNYGAEYTFQDTDTLQYGSHNNAVQMKVGDAKVNVLKGVKIGANETIVIVHPGDSKDASKNTLLKALSDKNQTLADDKKIKILTAGTWSEVSHNTLNFNGDDHVSLMDGDKIVDIIGVDADWGKDKTYRRRKSKDDANRPTTKNSYVEAFWEEAKRTVGDTETSKDNYADLGVATLSDFVELPAEPDVQDLTMIPEDNGSFHATLARYVGKKVRLPADIDKAEAGNQDMRVARTFSFDYSTFRHNMVLAYKRPNMHPNQKHAPLSLASIAADDQNKDYTLLIESTTKPKEGEIPYYPDFSSSADSAKENYIRIDDSVVGMEGMISYNSSKDLYTLTVTNTLTKDNFTHNTPRKDGKDLAKELTKVAHTDIEIKIATQNVLNYFNSPFGGAYNYNGGNRGATSYLEYERQKTKIVSAIRGLDADIVGLMEIENNGFGETSAIKELVDDVNLAYDEDKLSKKHQDNSTSNRYAFIGFDDNGDAIIDEEDKIGGDVITTGMLYRPEKVTLDAVKIIPMPSQHDKVVVNDNGVIVKNYRDDVLESGDNYMRDSLAATFIVNQTGKKLTVVVNHLKSKGSTCAEDWDGVELGTVEKLYFNKDKELLNKYNSNRDHQGNCEHFRVAAAVQLGEELEKISGDKVIVGDMNSYAQEDPMLVLTEIPEFAVKDPEKDISEYKGKVLTAAPKVIKAARNTYIGRVPQFGADGKIITKDYGYLNAVSLKDADSWSYSFENEIGSLDHILISPTLKDRVVDATDWHINAAESPFYDYNEDRKGDYADTFYQPDAFRSSDHDSAIMVLNYKPTETDGEPVHIAIEGGLANVPYVIPAAAGAQIGDLATISVTPISEDLDMSRAVASSKVLANKKIYVGSKKQYVLDTQPKLGVKGLKPGEYAVSMSLTRNGAPVAGSTVSYNINVAKQDSLTPKVMVPEYDETGGSFGMFSIMSLLGLGFLRRRKA